MFSLRSYFNRQSLTLIGLIIILVSIPLTVFLGQKAQELRGRAAPSGDVIFTDANGNSLGQPTTNQDVHLKIIPPDGWQLPSQSRINPIDDKSLITKVYAAVECSAYSVCENCTIGLPGCGWVDGSRCIPATSATCPAGVSSWAFTIGQCASPTTCQVSTPTPTPTPQPQPTTTSAPSQPTPTQPSTVGDCRKNPVEPPQGYQWTALCGQSCNTNADCPRGADNQEGWCYGFQGGSRCLRLDRISAEQQPTPTQPPAGPTVLRQIYIQNKDGGGGGHTPARITGADLNPYKKGGFLLVPWQLTDGVGQKSVQVDFYEQPDNDSAGRKTITASIQLSQPSAPQPPAAGGVDVGTCESITIDDQPFANDVPASQNPFILAGKTYNVKIKMANTQVGTPQNPWGSTYYLKYVGGSEDRLGLNPKQISVGGAQCNNVPVGTNGYCTFKFQFAPTLPTGVDKTDYQFYWQMHNGNNQPFYPGSGKCTPNIQVNATLPGASPPPGAPGTCPVGTEEFIDGVFRRWSCVAKTDGSTPYGCTSTRAGEKSCTDPNLTCAACISTFLTPTPTPSPTPTPWFQGCKQCFDQFCDSFRLRDDKCPQDRPVCFRDGSCVAGLPTATPTPPPGAPTLTPGVPLAPDLSGSCSANGSTLFYSWNPIGGATRYAIRINDKANDWGGNTVNPGDTVDNNVTGTSYSRSSSVGPQYEAWIHAVDSHGVYSAESTHFTFTCAGPTPTATPTLAPTPTPTPTPPPGSTVIPIQIALQEFVKAPQTRIGQKPRRLTRSDVEVRLTLTGSIPQGFTAGQQFQTRTTLQWVEQRFDGNLGFFEGLTAFAPNTLPSGTNTYNVAVKEATHLRKTVATNVSLTAAQQNQIVDGRNNILLVGSVDGDNTVDIVDHQILINCFGDKMTSDVCAGRGQDADLDDDGKVTIFDYNWLIENFGRTGDN